MDRGLLIRRLKYQACRRSTLELDVLLRTVVRRADWDGFTDEELAGLAHLMDLDEMVLQRAFLAGGPPPEGVTPELWIRVLALLGRDRLIDG